MTSSKLIVAFVAVLCVARSCSEMAEFGRKKIKLLKCFLKLKHGIPSHDTFSTVLRMLDQKALDAAFGRLTARLVATLANGGVIAIDGKSLKGAYDKGEKSSPRMMVSAYATARARGAPRSSCSRLAGIRWWTARSVRKIKMPRPPTGAPGTGDDRSRLPNRQPPFSCAYFQFTPGTCCPPARDRRPNSARRRQCRQCSGIAKLPRRRAAQRHGLSWRSTGR